MNTLRILVHWIETCRSNIKIRKKIYLAKVTDTDNENNSNEDFNILVAWIEDTIECRIVTSEYVLCLQHKKKIRF